MEQDSPSTRSFPIRVLPSDLVGMYANHFRTRSEGDLVAIEFAQFIMPDVESEEEFEAISATGLGASVVSRVFVPESLFVSFIREMYALLPDSEEVSE